MANSIESMAIQARGWRGTLWILLLAAPLVSAAPPSEIYVSRGDHGELSFSDVAAPGAERVEVQTASAVADPRAETERRIAQTLSVASALEQSRLAREKARAEARAAARTQPEPQVIYREPYVSRSRADTFPYVLDTHYRERFGYRHHRRDVGWDHREWRHGGHWDRDGGDRPRQRSRTISKPFVYDAE